MAGPSQSEIRDFSHTPHGLNTFEGLSPGCDLNRNFIEKQAG
jgi:hypothetical protein